LIRAAVARGWWEPISAAPGGDGGGEDPSPNGSNGEPTIVAGLDRARWDGLRLAPRVVMPANVADAHALIAGALDSGATVTAAIAGGDLIVGLVVSAAVEGRNAVEQVLAVGVAPELRRRGIATELLRRHVSGRPGRTFESVVTVAERDPFAPLDRNVRRAVAQRLLESTGFIVSRPPDPVGRLDPAAISGRHRSR
jgi:ribosomal protein S18 acetylase RimI-like enzyme